jgi:hypothetical protein
MENSEEQPKSDKRLDSLRDYILKLYAVGGIPLVLMGLAAVNQFLPWYAGDTTKQFIVTVILLVIGALTWSAASYLAIQKWKAEMAIVAKQDEIVLTAICNLAMDTKTHPDLLREKTDTLRDSLTSMGVRWVNANRMLPPSSGATSNSDSSA